MSDLFIVIVILIVLFFLALRSLFEQPNYYIGHDGSRIGERRNCYQRVVEFFWGEDTEFYSGEDTETMIKRHRGKARTLSQKLGECKESSLAAYHSGNHSRAKKYSKLANVYRHQRDELNRIAADVKFKQSNAGNHLNVVDLHGLFVKEAIKKLQERLEAVKRAGYRSLVVIVGRGLHSINGEPKLRPAVIQYAAENNLVCLPDVPNPGCVKFVFGDARPGLFM